MYLNMCMVMTVNDVDMIDHSKDNDHVNEIQYFENPESCEIFGVYMVNIDVMHCMMNINGILTLIFRILLLTLGI